MDEEDKRSDRDGLHAILMKWFVLVCVLGVTLIVIIMIHTDNVRSWQRTEACEAKGGVMVTGYIEGCVRISTIQDNK